MPYFTLGRRKVWVSLPKSPFILTSFYPTPTGNKKGRKCRLNVSCRTFGRRRSAEVSLKRAALHPRATKMRDSVAQACRAAPSSDKKARNCCSSVPCCTPRRRKVWVSLPRSPIHPYVILPCTFRQRKWAEVSPESVVLHPRATKMRDSVAQACRAALSGDDIGLKCCLRWGVGSHRSTSPLGRAVELHRWDTPWNCTGAGYTGYTMLRAVKRRR